MNDNRPYPLTEPCVMCNAVDVEVVSPADTAVCWLCDLEHKDVPFEPWHPDKLRTTRFNGGFVIYLEVDPVYK